MNLDILGETETRWTDASYIRRKDYIFSNSGRDHQQRGAGILVKGNLERNISGLWNHHDRIMILLKI